MNARKQIRSIVLRIERAHGPLAGLEAAKVAAAFIRNGLAVGESQEVAELSALAKLRHAESQLDLRLP